MNNVDKELFKFLLSTNQAISLDDNENFRTFINSLTKSYKIPCRQTIVKRLLEYRENLENDMKIKLKETKSVSLIFILPNLVI